MEKEISNETLGQLIIDNIHQPAWIKNQNLEYTNCNRELLNSLGQTTATSLLGKKDDELTWGDYSNSYQLADNEVLDRSHAIEYLNVSKPNINKYVVMSTRKSVLKNVSGECIGILGIINLLWPSARHAYRLLMNLDNSLLAQSGYKVDQYVFYENTITGTGNLTKKELLCLFYLLRGASNKDVSKLLNISLRTLETHLEHIKCKLNCYSKNELISKAIEKNLLRLIPKNVRIQDLLITKQVL